MADPFIKEVTIDMVNKKIGYTVHGIEQDRKTVTELHVVFTDEIEEQLISWASRISVSAKTRANGKVI